MELSGPRRWLLTMVAAAGIVAGGMVGAGIHGVSVGRHINIITGMLRHRNFTYMTMAMYRQLFMAHPPIS